MTIPSLPAKKANTCFMKCRSPSLSFTQSVMSLPRSISYNVQMQLSCSLYLRHMSWYWIGNSTNRYGLSCCNGSSAGFGGVKSSSFTLACGTNSLNSPIGSLRNNDGTGWRTYCTPWEDFTTSLLSDIFYVMIFSNKCSVCNVKMKSNNISSGINNTCDAKMFLNSVKL